MLHFFLSPLEVLAIIGLAVLYLVATRARRRSIAHLPGPDSDSWLVGTQAVLHYAFHRGDVSVGRQDIFLASNVQKVLGRLTFDGARNLALPSALKPALV